MCTQAYGSSYDSNTMICTVGDGAAVDACHGDSGGPLFNQVSESSGYMMHGVISGGYGCGNEGYPTIYTKVSAVRDWIDDIVQNN